MLNSQVLQASCETPGLHGYAVKYSPFDQNLIACAAAQNYGIKGGGGLLLCQRATGVQFSVSKNIPYGDALFDVTFSEASPNIVCAAGADGNIIIADYVSGNISLLRGHTREVYSVEWNPTRQDQSILSASWDGSVITWDPRCGSALQQYKGHKHFVYSACWAPRNLGIFASCSADGMLAIWDVRAPQQPSKAIQGSPTELLSCDWSKYDANVIATGSVDNSVAIWDLRRPLVPVQKFLHKMAVKKVRFSPFDAHVVASVSYDFTTQIYNLAANRVSLCLMNHKEFAYGFDWSLAIRNEFVDCGWDQRIVVTSIGGADTLSPNKM